MADGRRLALREGPIELIIEVDGVENERERALDQAVTTFSGLLAELAAELPALRTDTQALLSGQARLQGPVAKRMLHAVAPHSPTFVTPMAAVAGSVADHMLEAICHRRTLSRAYVNNGGDIALNLAAGSSFSVGICTSLKEGTIGAQLQVLAQQGIGGLATSGWAGRSHSLGIADAVTVLARSAAAADVAATLIANAVDVPGSSQVTRVPARELSPDSDLGDHAVTTAVGTLNVSERRAALEAGFECAKSMKLAGLILGAFLSLQGETRVLELDGTQALSSRSV